MEDLSLRQTNVLRDAAREWGPMVILREMLRLRLAKFAFLIIAITVVAAAFSPLLARHDPFKMNPMNNLAAPSGEFWLGSDRLGRDQLSRLIYGARISLLIGVSSVAISVVAGVAIGTVAGYFGHWWDEVLMRFIDGVASIPGLLLALGLVAITGGAVLNVILAIAITATTAVRSSPTDHLPSSRPSVTHPCRFRTANSAPLQYWLGVCVVCLWL